MQVGTLAFYVRIEVECRSSDGTLLSRKETSRRDIELKEGHNINFLQGARTQRLLDYDNRRKQAEEGTSETERPDGRGLVLAGVELRTPSEC